MKEEQLVIGKKYAQFGVMRFILELVGIADDFLFFNPLSDDAKTVFESAKNPDFPDCVAIHKGTVLEYLKPYTD